MKTLLLFLLAFLCLLAPLHAQTLSKEVRLIWADATDARDAGHYDDALLLMERAISLAQDYGPLYNSRGKAYFDMALSGQYNSAFDSLINLATQDYDAGLRCTGLADTVISEILINRGAAYGVQGQFDNALKDFNQGIRLNPQNKNGYLNRSLVYFNLGQYSKAIKDHTKYLKFDKNNAAVLYERGMLYRVLKKNKKAIADETRVIAQKPSWGIAYLERARAYAQSGNITAAKQDYDQAVKLGMLLEEFDGALLKKH